MVNTEQRNVMSSGWLNKTRIIFVVVICFLVGRTACFAETVALSWDANSESDLGGYKVYYKADSLSLPFDGTGAGEGGSPVDVHNLTTATVSGLDPSRTYYFAVTAYNTSGIESTYSNIVTVPKSVPQIVSPGSPANSPAASGTVPGTGSVGQTNRVPSTVIQDTTAPVVSLTAPGNNSSVSGTVVITAAASDNVGVSMVEFYRNGALLFASNVAPYAFNWNTTSVANGGCTLMAAAYDSTGNVKQSAGVSVMVNNTIPDVTAPLLGSFTLPTTAASLTVPVSALTASDSVGVTGYLISASATTPAASAGGWSASAPSIFTFATAGTKTAYAWAKDAAGNVSGSRAATTTIILPDTNILTLTDALLALQIGTGKVTPTVGQMTRLDVAPVVNGRSVPDGVINTGDAIVLLSKIVGKSIL
ncbi:MAG: Ig-like domain-containing protein [Desulfuromonadaceae bacterium]|nr:Ig-like domain-containing protein [Desulfuromonadaceae bacterium]